MSNVNALIQGLKDFNIDLNDDQVDKFIIYKEELLSWNEKINITAITEDVEVDMKHFLDSLTPSISGLLNSKKRLIDIGTGGGFPGLPLKILYKDLDVVLLDSLNKRIKFLNSLIDKLKLNSISAIHGRAEEIARKSDYRESFDIAISRAVASLDTLAEYCLPFVKPGGHFISMKGINVQEEVKQGKSAIDILGGKIIDIKEFSLPNTDMGRSLIIIQKISKTSTKYPRGGGKPKNKPL